MIVIVTHAFGSTGVCWYHPDTDLEIIGGVEPEVSASQNGVRVYSYLHQTPADLLATAQAVYETLAVDPAADLRALATHVRSDTGRGYEPAWLIWSDERNAWWGPDGHRYVHHVSVAGRFTRKEATRRSRIRTWQAGERPPEVLVPAPPYGLTGEPLTRWVEERKAEGTAKAIKDRVTTEQIMGILQWVTNDAAGRKIV
ncbi:hypothetical protein BDK92_7298 [Micromonospora pisi]|uniref:Uncharacterized protein n=1 Tax=Micromonospora pisi TaxID=589240 RepID=A0A495JUX9_9ACTN|nr:hypothetical protein [Micromonospora pisi]RKR92816.1 hypothetical protein BDK92_7298 [Micromonospora pisi]